MFSSANTAKEPNRDRKRCQYKCSCGQTEFTVTLEPDDRNLKRWCKICKHFIYPVAITWIRTQQRDLRVSKPRQRW